LQSKNCMASAARVRFAKGPVDSATKLSHQLLNALDCGKCVE